MKRRKKYDILVVGKKPFTGKNSMGYGGVGIHVSRLTDWLDREGINYYFYDLSLFKLWSLAKKISQSRAAHLHSSSPYMRVLFAFLCILNGTESVCTYHGNLGRFGKVKNAFDYLSIRIINYPIVLNDNSHSCGLKRNKKTRLISAYIPEINNTGITSSLAKKIENYRSAYKIMVVTNAFKLNYDKNGEEIYGIIPLVELIKDIPDACLIVSDSSGEYSSFLGESIPVNVMCIKEPHPFVGVLKYADVFVRNTSTDGDSLSIHESLEMNVPVIATDVVDRPNGCMIVPKGNNHLLKAAIESFRNHKKRTEKQLQEVEIFKFYRDVLLS